MPETTRDRCITPSFSPSTYHHGKLMDGEHTTLELPATFPIKPGCSTRFCGCFFIPTRYLPIFLGSLWIWRVLRSGAKCNGLAPQMAPGKFQRLHAFPFGSPDGFVQFPAPWQR